MDKLAIMGKVIDCSKIAQKSKAQFADQLRRNGIELDEVHMDSLWGDIQSVLKAEAEEAAKQAEEAASVEVEPIND